MELEQKERDRISAKYPLNSKAKKIKAEYGPYYYQEEWKAEKEREAEVKEKERRERVA